VLPSTRLRCDRLAVKSLKKMETGMRMLLLAGTLMIGVAGSAVAQMCGAPQQQGASAGMAGCMGMRQTQADDPMADKPTPRPQASGMMCPCCKNMAMMGTQPETPKAEPKHDMPMPKQ
jgi:hypothetical protein